MSDRPPADRTARLLLRYYREPSRFRVEALQPDAPRLEGGVVLKLALGHRVEFAEAALNRLSVSVLRDAAASYVRRMYFRADATPYQTLGLAPDASAEAIKDNFRLLMQLVHPDRQDAQARWPESCAAQANRAYGMLKNEESRAKFDREEAERVRAAAAQAARSAMMAAPAAGRWPETGYAAGRSPERALLPEWLTGAVGGFVRAHPALVGFSVLIGGAVLVIGATVRDGESGSLTREERLARAPDRALAPTPAPAPALAPTSPPTPTLASAPMPVPAPHRHRPPRRHRHRHRHGPRAGIDTDIGIGPRAGTGTGGRRGRRIEASIRAGDRSGRATAGRRRARPARGDDQRSAAARRHRGSQPQRARRGRQRRRRHARRGGDRRRRRTRRTDRNDRDTAGCARRDGTHVAHHRRNRGAVRHVRRVLRSRPRSTRLPRCSTTTPSRTSAAAARRSAANTTSSSACPAGARCS